ncbi:YHS domain-containing protein [Tundrisphaera lichenicola]|uniref:YHS domain-containing protein n=1 Tax=Tundrisphaera lichenicola TaxID=2029860 RepID=UPI003EBE7781
MITGLFLVSTLGVLATASPVDEIPSPFLPFEQMIGGWKGTATPTANRLKGWQESHSWAWKFEKGKPTGMSLTFEGNKTIAKAQLTFDSSAKKYRVDGTDPLGKPLQYLGSLGTDGKSLTLDRVGPESGTQERLLIWPNSNKIRYTFNVERQERGAPQYKRVVTVGLTKTGESFAAGGEGSNLPRCIMTGGASTLTVSYQGKTYPVCCTGCRDEFNDNPEKYARKAEEVAKAKPDQGKPAKPATKPKDDGSFDGLVEDLKPKPKP